MQVEQQMKQKKYPPTKLEMAAIVFALRWLRTVHVWLLVRFTVLPLIYSCAGNTCGKLVNGHERGVVN